MEGRKEERMKRVCVTGAGGFLALWVVKLPLSKGYHVHAIVRDPSNEKNAHLMKLEGASAESLQLFKADLLDFEAMRSAIAGCDGVFHVACPVPPTKLLNPEVEMIARAVTGTLNVLKAFSAENVKRVVVVSSRAAVAWNPNWPKNRVMDESCWSDKEYCKITETLAEEEALKYAENHEIDVVTVCPSLVIGPLLQSTVNFSSMVLINLLKGLPEAEAVENKITHFVDVRDFADAALLVYENTKASGWYICSPDFMKIGDIVDLLKTIYPIYNYPKNITEVDDGNQTVVMTSDKLKSLGWRCRTPKESLIDSVECYRKAGFLDTTS